MNNTLNNKIQFLVDQLLNSFFSDLKTYNIKIQTYYRHNTFFETSVDKFYLNAKNRVYILLVNKKLEIDCPSDEALRAILVHEFIHLRDYTQSSSLELAMLAFKVHWMRSFTTAYERSIDKRSLEYNTHDGLIEYRQWLYKKISPEQIAIKKRDYLTPDEILLLKNNLIP